MDSLKGPRARVTLPLLALVGAALLAGPLYVHSQRLTEADVLGLASDRGIAPAAARPAKGTPIYQWDPEIRDFPPTLIGKVTDLDVRSGKDRYVRVAMPHVRPLLLDIRPGEMRYWVRPEK